MSYFSYKLSDGQAYVPSVYTENVNVYPQPPVVVQTGALLQKIATQFLKDVDAPECEARDVFVKMIAIISFFLDDDKLPAIYVGVEKFGSLVRNSTQPVFKFVKNMEKEELVDMFIGLYKYIAKTLVIFGIIHVVFAVGLGKVSPAEPDPPYNYINQRVTFRGNTSLNGTETEGYKEFFESFDKADTLRLTHACEVNSSGRPSFLRRLLCCIPRPAAKR